MSGASISRIFARPENFPLPLSRRCEQWLGRRPESQVPAEIKDQQPISVRASTEAQNKCFRSQYGSGDPIGTLRAEYRIFAAQFQKIPVQGRHVFISTALFRDQLALLECVPLVWRAHREFGMRTSDAGKLSEKCGTAFLDKSSDLFVLIGKKGKWSRC